MISPYWRTVKCQPEFGMGSDAALHAGRCWSLLTILYMWNSPLPAPALLPDTFMILVGTFSVMNLSFSSSSSACYTDPYQTLPRLSTGTSSSKSFIVECLYAQIDEQSALTSFKRFSCSSSVIWSPLGRTTSAWLPEFSAPLLPSLYSWILMPSSFTNRFSKSIRCRIWDFYCRQVLESSWHAEEAWCKIGTTLFSDSISSRCNPLVTA